MRRILLVLALALIVLVSVVAFPVLVFGSAADVTPLPIRGVAFRVDEIYIHGPDGNLLAGLTPATKYIQVDSGPTWSTWSGSLVDLGHGKYAIDLTSGEMDHRSVDVVFTFASTTPVSVHVTTSTDSGEQWPVLDQGGGGGGGGGTCTNCDLIDDIKNKTDLITSGVAIRVDLPQVIAGVMPVRPGDAYRIVDSGAFAYTLGSNPDLTGATAVLKVWIGSTLNHYERLVFSDEATITSFGGATQQVKAEMTAAQSALIKFNVATYFFRIRSTLATGSPVTLVSGGVTPTP